MEAMATAPGAHWQFIWEKQDEQRDWMTIAIAMAYRKWEASQNPEWTKPKIGDLVMVCNFE